MRKVVFGIFMALYAIAIVSGLLNRDVVSVIVTAVMALDLWYAFRLINQVLLKEGDTAPLTHAEKVTVLLTEFLNPIFAGAFYYYSWRKKFPNKASQANKYSFLLFGLQVVLVILLRILLG
jgi:hypothetical protein